MTKEETLNILNQYKECVAKGAIGGTVFRKASWLPYSKGKIKHAYFTFIEYSIKDKGNLPDEEELISNYCLLSFFIEDPIAEKYAKDYEGWQAKKRSFERNKKDEIFAKQYIAYTHMLKNSGLLEEIQNYINELKKNA